MKRRMFTPIKNFITYIQKNASGNSIFGGNNSTAEESAKMETENMKIEQETATVTESARMQSENEIPKETVEKDRSSINTIIIIVYHIYISCRKYIHTIYTQIDFS